LRRAGRKFGRTDKIKRASIDLPVIFCYTKGALRPPKIPYFLGQCPLASLSLLYYIKERGIFSKTDCGQEQKKRN